MSERKRASGQRDWTDYCEPAAVAITEQFIPSLQMAAGRFDRKEFDIQARQLWEALRSANTPAADPYKIHLTTLCSDVDDSSLTTVALEGAERAKIKTIYELRCAHKDSRLPSNFGPSSLAELYGRALDYIHTHYR